MDIRPNTPNLIVSMELVHSSEVSWDLENLCIKFDLIFVIRWKILTIWNLKVYAGAWKT